MLDRTLESPLLDVGRDKFSWISSTAWYDIGDLLFLSSSTEYLTSIYWEGISSSIWGGVPGGKIYSAFPFAFKL